MPRKITIWKLLGKVFLINSLEDILILRNSFRIQGTLVKKEFLDFENFFCLVLNTEEILLGMEGGFFKIRTIIFFPESFLKLSFFRFLHGEKFSKKPSNFNTKKKKNLSFIKKWREDREIFLKLFLLKMNSKKVFSGKNFYLLSNKFSQVSPENSLSLGFKTCFYDLNFVDYNRYLVFRDLWQRGFILSCGLKFGATFLVYANNVGIVHSFLSVWVLSYPPILHLGSFVSFGRLGTITRKSTLITILSGRSFIYYFNLKWHKDLP